MIKFVEKFDIVLGTYSPALPNIYQIPYMFRCKELDGKVEFRGPKLYKKQKRFRKSVYIGKGFLETIPKIIPVNIGWTLTQSYI